MLTLVVALAVTAPAPKASGDPAPDSIGRWVIERIAPAPGDTIRARLVLRRVRTNPVNVRLIAPSGGAVWFGSGAGTCDGRRAPVTATTVGVDGGNVLAVCAHLDQRGSEILLAEIEDSIPKGGARVSLIASPTLEVGKPAPEETWLAPLLAGVIGVVATLLGAIVSYFLSGKQERRAAVLKWQNESRDTLKLIVDKINLELYDHSRVLIAVAKRGPAPDTILTVAGYDLIVQNAAVTEYLARMGEDAYAKQLKAYYERANEYDRDLDTWNGLREAAASAGQKEEEKELADLKERLRKEAEEIRVLIPRTRKA